jgi:hypothetical protein
MDAVAALLFFVSMFLLYSKESNEWMRAKSDV